MGTRNTAGSKQDVERSISLFSGYFFVLFAVLLCFQPWIREESRARCHLDPLENSVVKWARK